MESFRTRGLEEEKQSKLGCFRDFQLAHSQSTLPQQGRLEIISCLEIRTRSPEPSHCTLVTGSTCYFARGNNLCRKDMLALGGAVILQVEPHLINTAAMLQLVAPCTTTKQLKQHLHRAALGGGSSWFIVPH